MAYIDLMPVKKTQQNWAQRRLLLMSEDNQPDDEFQEFLFGCYNLQI